MPINWIHNQQVSFNSLATTNGLDVGQEMLSAHVDMQLSL